MAKKARLEVLVDDGYWPACSTPKATSTIAQWSYVGEGFIKELDFSRVWLRLNEHDEFEKEEIVGELKMEASKFLLDALVRCYDISEWALLTYLRTGPQNSSWNVQETAATVLWKLRQNTFLST